MIDKVERMYYNAELDKLAAKINELVDKVNELSEKPKPKRVSKKS